MGEFAGGEPWQFRCQHPEEPPLPPHCAEPSSSLTIYIYPLEDKDILFELTFGKEKRFLDNLWKGVAFTMTDVYIPPHPSFMLMSDYMACHEEQQAAKRAQITAQSISRSDSSSEEEQTTTAEQMDIDMASLPSPPASPTEPNWVGMLMGELHVVHTSFANTD